MTRPRPSAASVAIAVAIAAAAFRAASGEEYGWPLEPQNAVHTVANTLEPYWSFGTDRWRFHAGIDLRAVPYLNGLGKEDTERTLVKAVAAGKIVKVRLNEKSPDNYLVIESANGERHAYLHLAAVTVPQQLSVLGASVVKGEFLGAVDRWPDCGFDHLHFERRSSDRRVLDPLAAIAPRSDTTPPQIASIVVAPHEAFKRREEDGAEVVPSGCFSLASGSEVHVRIDDMGDVGGLGRYNVGLRGLRLDWLPPGEAEYLSIEEIRPTDVATAAPSSTDAVERVVVGRGKFAASGSYCGGKTLRYRLGGDDSGGGAIDPTWMGPGMHTLRLQAVDFAGATSEARFRVCVAGNGFRCGGFPLLKDCAADTGLLPSACSDSEGSAVSWLEPPGSETAAVRVCVTNGGCEPLDLSGTIAVRVELWDCSGPECAGLTGPWDRKVHGIGDESGSVASGDSRCVQVSLGPELGEALASLTSGRLVVRVSTEKGVFASNSVQLDPAAASVELPADSDDPGPP